MSKIKRNKRTRLLGTNSLPLGSIWEIGLTADDVYRQCRVYLKTNEKEPAGDVIYLDQKNQQEYMISDGIKVYFHSGDEKPDATYVYLGKRGGRYVIDEDKIGFILRKASRKR